MRWLMRNGTSWSAARCAAVAAVAAAVSVMHASPAFAGAAGSDGPGGTVTVGASDGVSSPGGPGGGAGAPGGGSGGGANGGSPWVCIDTSLVLNDEGGFAPGGPTPGGWYSVTCIDDVTGAATTRTEWIPDQAAATAPAVDPHEVALQAERSLDLPVPSLFFNPSGSSVVNLPTWLWIDAGIWHQDSVTASAGTVSATAVATPESVTWEMGDGGVVVCVGPGRPFQLGLPADTQSTPCAFTYRTSSIGQPSADGNPDDAAYTVRATITWDVSWTAQGAPGQGVLPSLTTSAESSLRVVQVESVNSAAFGSSDLRTPAGGLPA